MLIGEAERWSADAIMIGAKGHRILERVLIGSVSTSVTARAHCTVEVVR
jgi:nucleotide-binding universal stress UspA family protein